MQIKFNRGNREIIEAEYRVLSEVKAEKNFATKQAYRAYGKASDRMASGYGQNSRRFAQEDSFETFGDFERRKNFRQKQAANSYGEQSQALKDRLAKLSSEIRNDLDTYDARKSFPYANGMNSLAIA